MNRIALVVLGIVLAGWPPAWARGADGPAQEPAPFLGGYLQESRVVYPLRVGQWQAMDEHRYEQAESGASVRYRDSRHADRWIDLYLYPAGPLLDPAFAAAVEQEAAQILSARRDAGDAVAETTPARSFAAPGEQDPLLGELAPKPRSVAFAIDLAGKRYHSVLAMTVRGMYFIKVRFSAEARSIALDDLRREGEDFLATFAGTVRILNSGGCSRLPVVEPLPADRIKPGDLFASANEGQGEEVWVAADRLYVAAPGTGDAAARDTALALGNALHDALRGHCVQPESMNPKVPEGMREMRFEYGRPSEAPPAMQGGRTPSRA